MGTQFMETILLHVEKKRGGGKIVTILEGFTRDRSYMEGLASRLKRFLGTGGTLKHQKVEIQGDFRSRLREILLKEGFQVKG